MLKTIKQVTLHLETREIWLHKILHTFPMGIASACSDKLCTAATVYFLARNKVICTCLSLQSFLVAITRLRWNQMQQSQLIKVVQLLTVCNTVRIESSLSCNLLATQLATSHGDEHDIMNMILLYHSMCQCNGTYHMY